jgi:hypothetical protein
MRHANRCARIGGNLVTADDDAPIDVWTIEAVNGGQVTFLINGEVIMLLTSGEEQVFLDDIFAQRVPGKPVELKKEQAIRLARLILSTVGETE